MATGNPFKFREIAALLKTHRLKAVRRGVKTLEIQHDDLREIAVQALVEALKRSKGPLLIEDAGMYVEALKGFPGPYSAYSFRTIGVEGILRLLKGVRNREAEFRSVVAYGRRPEDMQVFEGAVHGVISLKPRGTCGFGFDPIFVPKGRRKTFAEMELKEKNKCSHRAVAVAGFAKWYLAEARRRRPGVRNLYV